MTSPEIEDKALNETSPINGDDTLINKLLKIPYVKSIKEKLENLLTQDGIGDKMDKGNLFIIPGFALFAFAVLWTTKLSTTAFAESTCKGASIYDLGTKLELDAQRHCETAKRYYKEINEPFQYDQAWREARQVKNPEWILWFWAPIVFVMYVLTRFAWSLLMENQGINFEKTAAAVKNIDELDEGKLKEEIQTIADNFRSATSSHVFAAFIWFKISLVVAPCALLIFILPIFVGASYRTWGLDVAQTWWERKEWQGSTLTPFFGSNVTPIMPLIPRYTYCDYHFNTLGNDHVLTYRCYLDANWHERTALFTWYMLVFLIFINLCNLFFWLIWAIKMYNDDCRQKYVKDTWLHGVAGDSDKVDEFAKKFKMSHLILFYFIEAHTDRVTTSYFAQAVFKNWTYCHTKHDKPNGWFSRTFRKIFCCVNASPDPQQNTLDAQPTNEGAQDDIAPGIGIFSFHRPTELPPITDKEKYRNKGSTFESAAAAATDPPDSTSKSTDGDATILQMPPDSSVAPSVRSLCTIM